MGDPFFSPGAESDLFWADREGGIDLGGVEAAGECDWEGEGDREGEGEGRGADPRLFVAEGGGDDEAGIGGGESRGCWDSDLFRNPAVLALLSRYKRDQDQAGYNLGKQAHKSKILW